MNVGRSPEVPGSLAKVIPVSDNAGYVLSPDSLSACDGVRLHTLPGVNFEVVPDN